MKFLEAFTICNSEIGIRRNSNPGLLSSDSVALTGFIELQMINGVGTGKATFEAGSLDRFESLPALQVSQVDDGDASSPSTRYSSCGESDFDRYCSANSVLGTPSVCSTITIFNDFTEDDNSGLENFSIGERVGTTSKDQRISSTDASGSMRYLQTGIHSETIRTQQNLKYSSSRLELYGDDDENVLAMPIVDASGFMSTNQLENDLDQSSISILKDVEDFEVSKGQNKIGGDREYLETLSGNESGDAGTTDRYLLGDVNGKFSRSVSTVGGENEYNGRESNLHTGKATDPNTGKPQVKDVEKLVNCPKTYFTAEDYGVCVNLVAKEAPNYLSFDFNDVQTVEQANSTSNAQHVKKPELDNSKGKFDLFLNGKVDLKSFNLALHAGNINAESFEKLERIVPSLNCKKTLDKSFTPANLSKKSTAVSKIEDIQPHEFYDDAHEMEEILLDSIDSSGCRLAQGNSLLEPQLSMPLRDSGLTASTSGIDGACLLGQPPKRLDRVEVVGARQKKGDVSFSKRLAGVKEYTVYKIKVWSGKDQWVIERRYRDFLTLYHCMKTLFMEQSWDLPCPWYAVEKETKKIFVSASPEVIVRRSVLLQECLQSILHIRFFSSPPCALIWFLSPPSALVSNSCFTSATINRNYSGSGKTIPLLVEIPLCKSMEQMLEAQQNCCVGCHKHFDDRKTLIWDFVQSFGWGKPRLCEYTGKLFCSSCHINETAILPARVLHHWDFTHYPVSQLAKSYLDSINDQPLLCVTAVNLSLLSKVPALLHVMSIRKKIATMLPYVICPFRRSINSGLGARRYLLENNDFFSLKDLIDLSKGAFAALPGLVETVTRKILKHITNQCIMCCDVGVPCSARHDCSDPCSLIFPFQEEEIERCTTCHSIFHKPCFRKLINCSCGARLRLSNRVRPVRNW